jgi:hypothetical protein
MTYVMLLSGRAQFGNLTRVMTRRTSPEDFQLASV